MSFRELKEEDGNENEFQFDDDILDDDSFEADIDSAAASNNDVFANSDSNLNNLAKRLKLQSFFDFLHWVTKIFSWLKENIPELIGNISSFTSSQRFRRTMAVIGICIALILLGLFLWSIHDAIGIVGILAISVAILVIVVSIVSVRDERDIVEERLSRFEQDYQSFLDVEEDIYDKQVKKNLQLAAAITERPFGAKIKQSINQADLNLTLAEYVIISIIFIVLCLSISNILFPNTIIVTAIVGVLASLIPNSLISMLGKYRLHQFDAQFPNALILWSNSLRSGNTIAQSIEALAKHAPDRVASEFQRVSIDLHLGYTLEEALANLYERIPSHYLRLAIDAVYLQSLDGIALDETFSSIIKHIQSVQQIHLTNGYLIYAHDLMFPIVIAVLFLQAQLLERYFAPILTNSTKTILVFAYALITITMLVVGETGKELKRLEQRYELPTYRGFTTSNIVVIVRIISFLLFIYFNILNPNNVYVMWAWFMFFCLESSYAIIPIIIVVITLAVQIGGDINLGQLLTIIQWQPSLLLIEIVLCCVVVTLLSVLIATWQINRNKKNIDPIMNRIAQYGESIEIPSIREIELSLNIFERLIVPILSKLGYFFAYLSPEAQVKSLEQKIARAGLDIHPATFILIRILMACSFSLGVLYLLTNVSSLNIFWVLIGTLGGMIGGSDLPILYLNSRIRSRQRIIRQELPELMLLLETGNKGRIATLGIFANIYEHWDSILGNTMGKIVKMTQLGTSLEHSINKVATDLDVPEFYKLCSGILQFQDNHDSLASFMASLREQFYQNEELEIQNKTKPYRLWHNFAYRYILWIGLVFWLLAPIITS